MEHKDICGVEHLHRHTDNSVLDGYAMVSEYAAYSKQVNQQFLCITDHGMMSAIPQQIQACDKHGIKPIFGCELYIHPKQPEIPLGQSMSNFTKPMSPEERKELRKSFHLLALAASQEGYSNLVHLTSWGWLHGFYYKPRINHEQLVKHKDGIIFGSGCYNCEIGQAFDKFGEEEAMEMVRKYKEMLGDQLYLEVMLLDFEKQKPYNAFLVKAHEKFGIPMIVTNDCHYCKQEDSHMQRLMLMVQTQKTLAELQAAYEEGSAKDLFELQDQNLWMKSEDEMNTKWELDYQDVLDYELFKEAKRNTVRICQQAQGVELDRSIKLPKIEDENEKLRVAIMEGFKERGLPMEEKYLGRIKEEFPLICQKEFASYFLIQKMMTDEARRWAAEKYGTDGSEAVGPGRGSGAGALTNYCLGVTDVDPLLHGLMFSRFMSSARGGKSIKLRFKGNYDLPKPDPEPESAIVESDVPPWEEEGEKAPWEE